MSDILTPADVFSLDLTATALRARGVRPLVAGDDRVLRFQIRRLGQARSLTGALVIFTMRLGLGSVTAFTRSSAVALGVGRFEVEFDADQDVEGDGEGLGWGGVRFTRADQDALLAFCGAARRFDLRAKLAEDSEIQTQARGPIEWLRPEGLAIV